MAKCVLYSVNFHEIGEHQTKANVIKVQTFRVRPRNRPREQGWILWQIYQYGV